eukprot:3847023-Amphidinium_carterae.1
MQEDILEQIRNDMRRVHEHLTQMSPLATPRDVPRSADLISSALEGTDGWKNLKKALEGNPYDQNGVHEKVVQSQSAQLNGHSGATKPRARRSKAKKKRGSYEGSTSSDDVGGKQDDDHSVEFLDVPSEQTPAVLLDRPNDSHHHVGDD